MERLRINKLYNSYCKELINWRPESGNWRPSGSPLPSLVQHPGPLKEAHRPSMKLSSKQKAKQKAQCRSEWTLARLSCASGASAISLFTVTPEKATRPPSPSASSEKFKFLSEIVFEGGPDNIYGVTRGEINTFSVDVERYLIQYSYNDYLNVAAGRFHTAIGYYNTAYHHSTWFQ